MGGRRKEGGRRARGRRKEVEDASEGGKRREGTVGGRLEKAKRGTYGWKEVTGRRRRRRREMRLME